MGGRPLEDVPVVVRGHDGRRELLVLDACPRQAHAVETREGGEAHGREDAVRVHVTYTVMDVVTAGAHLGEADGVESPLLVGPRGNRVEPDGAGADAAPLPLVDAVGGPHDFRGTVSVLVWDVAIEHGRRFDDVVVDADEDEIVGSHCSPLGSSGARCGLCQTLTLSHNMTPRFVRQRGPQGLATSREGWLHA